MKLSTANADWIHFDDGQLTLEDLIDQAAAGAWDSSAYGRTNTAMDPVVPFAADRGVTFTISETDIVSYAPDADGDALHTALALPWFPAVLSTPPKRTLPGHPRTF